MNLNKEPKFNLSKGDKIDLKKDDGGQLTHLCMGANWSAIDKKGFFGGIKKEAVDLDASCTMFDESGAHIDTVFFGQKKSKASGFISHSGDDLVGDTDGDDGLDNEVIQVDLTKAPANVHSVWFYLNSFSGQDFGAIPNVSIRIYEGTPSRIDNNFAQMVLHNAPNFQGKKAMVLGKVYKRNNAWKFETVGEALPVQKIPDIIKTIQQNLL